MFIYSITRFFSHEEQKEKVKRAKLRDVIKTQPATIDECSYF
jgi:hypothetical protein